MNWEKKGLIFKPHGKDSEMVSHAAIPFGLRMDEETVRIYFSSRNSKGKSLPFFLDIETKNPKRIIRVQQKPLLNLGKLGTFDDSGIMPSSFVKSGNDIYMYYIGWNPQVTVSYRLSIGLAISSDSGENFEKYTEGPICDRSIEEPYFNTAPFVLKDNNIWRMWYISCTKWEIINNYPEPFYHVKYAESKDGINWTKTGIICIDYDDFAQAIGRPSVFKEDGLYKMYYSYRRVTNYRTNPADAYRLGYAESTDGKIWTKKNDMTGIHLSFDQNEWDSKMMEYCHVLKMQESKIMFYNGNGFGESGFGYAEQK